MLKPYFSTDKVKISRVMQTALGELPADLAVVNGDVVNVYTGEIMTRQTVLIKDGVIAYVGDNAPRTAIGPATEIIEADGRTLIPGFIDGHTHVEEPWPVDEFTKYALKSGTTTVITEVADIGSLLGYPGITAFMTMCRPQPVRFFFTIPPIVHASPANTRPAALTPAEYKRLLRRQDVLGIGEIPWNQTDRNHPRLLEMIAAALNAGKTVEGHSAGARNSKLQAYFAAGASSCHESITAGEVLERLRAGIFVPIREGVVRKELEEVSKIKDEPIDFSLLGICSDGIDPRQLVNDGYMDFLVQKLINYGFNPVTAIQMATINVARHFRLDYLGGIAPGKLADITIIPDIKIIEPEDVIINGQIMLRNGKLTVKPPKTAFPKLYHNTVRLKEYQPADFNITVNRSGKIKVRVIDQVSDLITREAILEMPVKHKIIETDLSRDILKAAVINRYREPDKMAVGFIRGFGLKRGAIAASTLWDGANIGVIGTNSDDMALAVNRIKKLQGGIIICAGGKILTEFALPLSGMAADKSMEFIAGKYDEIQQTAASLGTKLPMAQMSLRILTTPFIPFFRMSEEGYFDLSSNKPAGLIVE